MDGKSWKRAPRMDRKGKVDDLTEAGALLGAVGGIFMGASALVPWVAGGGNDLSVFEMIDESRAYLVTLVMQLLALICAMMSAILLRSSDWPRERKLPWAIPLVVLNVLMIVFLAVTLIMMESDFLGKDGFIYGAGPYLGIFGMMFSWVGALMFVLDARERTSLRPTSRSSIRMTHAPPSESAMGFGHLQCPLCGEEVPDDSPICPYCNAVLSDDAASAEDGLDEEDIERVR
ncbi:MAG: zinc ribbon domain-containing protein [Methanomassiliicoccales archaeon]|nr:MAG: zinc ribbon domain-containing protein [Methanomassiliicoccales archaeon]